MNDGRKRLPLGPLYIAAAVLLLAGVAAFGAGQIMFSAGLCLCATCCFAIARRQVHDDRTDRP